MLAGRARIAECELRISNYELLLAHSWSAHSPITNHELQIAILKAQLAIREWRPSRRHLQEEVEAQKTEYRVRRPGGEQRGQLSYGAHCFGKC